MLLKTPINRIGQEQVELNEELRESFFKEHAVWGSLPTKQEIIAAVEPIFPELLDLDCQSILENVGIVVVGRFIEERISYSVAIDPVSAKQQYELYSGEKYQQIRDTLGISYHWVCNINYQTGILWYYDLNDWINACVKFHDMDGAPYCWIFDQARNLNE